MRYTANYSKNSIKRNFEIPKTKSVYYGRFSFSKS